LEPITSIIKGCLLNDHKYQKILYERYYGFALKIVFRYIFKYDRARDVVNDGFVKLFTHLASFEAGQVADTEKILMGWVRRIMINASIDELRRIRLLPGVIAIPDDIWDIPDKSSNAEQALMYRDLVLLLNRLPEQYRLVFNLYIIDGYSHQEIADSLKISVGTSKSSLSRARALIQKLIKEEDHVIYVSPEPRYG
jgi:RNA polymerase sigma factor (sigma-70 family)